MIVMIVVDEILLALININIWVVIVVYQVHIIVIAINY